MSGMITQKIRGVVESMQNRAKGVPTGFHLLDYHTFGLHPKEVTIIAGRPSMGKSSLMADLAINVSTLCPVMAFSLEMPEELLIERLISNKAEVSLRRLKQPEILVEEEIKKRDRAVLALENRDIVINDSSILNPEQIKQRLTAFRELVNKEFQSKKYQYNTGVVLVDYLGLLDSDKWTQNTNDKLDYFLKTFHQAARDLDLAVVVLHQLNRKVEDRPDHTPRLADLRDSGTVEQHADNVILLHRPSYYQMKDLGMDVEDDGEAYFILAKQRNGATGKIPVVYIPEIMGFRNTGSWCGQDDQTPLLDMFPETPALDENEKFYPEGQLDPNPYDHNMPEDEEETEDATEYVGEIKPWVPQNQIVDGEENEYPETGDDLPF